MIVWVDAQLPPQVATRLSEAFDIEAKKLLESGEDIVEIEDVRDRTL